MCSFTFSDSCGASFDPERGACPRRCMHDPILGTLIAIPITAALFNGPMLFYPPMMTGLQGEESSSAAIAWGLAPTFSTLIAVSVTGGVRSPLYIVVFGPFSSVLLRPDPPAPA